MNIKVNQADWYAILVIAIIVTSLAISMAVVSAVARGGSTIEKVLLAILFAILVICVHILPSAIESRLKWGLVVIGLAIVGYGQVSFFAQAHSHNIENRLQSSIEYQAIQRKILAVEELLKNIHARPVTDIAAEMATDHESRRHKLLELQLLESRRQINLQKKLDQLNELASTLSVIEQEDPATRLLSATLRVRPPVISLLINVMSSILVEIVGMVLWHEVLRKWNSGQIVNNSNDLLCILSAAIDRGECKKTVSGIREFLKCSQETALTMRRALDKDNYA